jgi:hypothetical protein
LGRKQDDTLWPLTANGLKAVGTRSTKRAQLVEGYFAREEVGRLRSQCERIMGSREVRLCKEWGTNCVVAGMRGGEDGKR